MSLGMCFVKKKGIGQLNVAAMTIYSFQILLTTPSIFLCNTLIYIRIKVLLVLPSNIIFFAYQQNKTIHTIQFSNHIRISGLINLMISPDHRDLFMRILD